jgi:signal transduction histidine kinase
VELHIRDDGVGFDPRLIPAECLGLQIIRERARAVGATLKIESKRGEGTRVVVNWEG